MAEGIRAYDCTHRPPSWTSCTRCVLMSLIEGFEVQKWMRERGRIREAEAIVANKGSDDRWNDLQLVFNHLDAQRRGNISLSAIRNALSMVELSEDPARHDHLSESIVSCFHAPGLPKSTGGAVDFSQFVSVMAHREQGRKFNTLQDELRSEGLAAAKAHFTNIFRKEVVVRKLLDAGGTAGFMCSAFQMLFKAEGLAASSSDRIQKLRLLEETVKSKRSRKIECKRAEQAKTKLLESSRSGNQNTRRLPPQACLRLSFSAAPSSGIVVNAEGVETGSGGTDATPKDDVKKQPELHPGSTRASMRRVFLACRGRSSQWKENISGPNGSVHLKKQAVRDATAVLGLHYAPSPPSDDSPVTQKANAFRGRRWGVGSNGTSCSATSKKIKIGLAAGGFVRYPSASVRRLRRRRRQRHPPAPGLPRWGRGNRGVVGNILMDPTDLEGKGVRACDVTSRRKDAILKRTPLCGRSAMARLPSWASCENSACDPGTAPPPLRQDTTSIASSAGKGASDPRGVVHELPMRSGAGDAGAHVSAGATPGGGAPLPPHAGEIGTAPLSATSLDEKEWWATSLGEKDWWEENHSLFSPRFSGGSLSATTTMTHSVKTIATTIPTAMTHEVSRDPLVTSRDNISSRVSSSSSISLEPARKTVHLDGGDAQEFHPAEGTVPGEEGRGLLLPKRPGNPTVRAREGKRPNGCRFFRASGGGGGQVGGGAKAAWPPPTPWRAPRLVRCMRRPDPKFGGGHLHNNG
ncbi:unnamed protein product [Ectocarpus fasciculatus]